MNRSLLAIAAFTALPAVTAHAVDVISLFDLGGRPGFHIHGLETNDWFGLPVAGVGDFNGDGIGDFVIGAEHGSPGEGGASYLVFGRTTPFPASFDLASLNGSNGMRIDSGLNFGNSFAVSGAGDFNADGYADLLMGTIDINMSRGRVCVVFGGATHPAVLSLATINGSNGTCYYGLSEYDNIGYVTSPAGDVNGDGIDDIAFGSVILNARGVDDGGIYVVFGRSGAFPAGQSLATINGSNGFLFVGQKAGDKLGINVAPAGDINGDGLDDLMIGSEMEESRRGAVYVLFGRTEPFSALMSPSDIDGVTGLRLLGARVVDGLGRGVGGVDFDQDGYSDMLAGTTFGGLGNQNGSASVVYGHPGPFPAQIDIGSLDGSNGRAFFGSTYLERLGEQMISAGDINGDGYPDLMVSAPHAAFAGLDTGSVYIVYGRPERGHNSSYFWDTTLGLRCS